MRQNKMSDSTKFLLLAATVIVVCVLVAAGFMMVKNGQSSVSGGVNQFNEMASDYADVNLAGYDGGVVLGSEVINFLRKLKDEKYDFTVEVKTKDNKAGVSYTKDTEKVPKTESTIDPDYINPHGQFLGDVKKNKNGIVELVSFKQQ